MEFLLGFSCPAKTPKAMHSYFSKPLKSCPDFSSSYGEVPAFESITPFTGGEHPLETPFISLLPAWLLETPLSLWPIQRAFSFGASPFTEFPNKMTAQTKEAQKHAAVPGTGEEKAPRLKRKHNSFYCRRLQQQRREKTAQLAKEERARCLPKAES